MKEIKKIWSFMVGYRLIYVFGIIAMILSQVINIISPMIIRTTIDSIIGAQAIDIDIVSKIVSYLGGVDYLKNNLYIVALLIILVAIFRGIFLYYRSTLSSKAAEATSKTIRDRLYDHIQRLPYSYHSQAETGDLIQRCTSDVETIKRFLAIQLVEVVGSIFMFAIVAGVMLSINVKMALISMISSPIIFVFAIIFFTKVKEQFTEADEAEAKLTTNLQENLTGIRVVKAFARQKFEIDKFQINNEDYRYKVNKLIRLLAIYWGSSDFICFLQIGLVIISGGYFVVLGEITLGTLVAFTTYVNMLLWPIRQMGRTLTDMGKAIVSVRRIEEILDQPIENLYEYKKRPKIEGSISFDNVSFNYNNSKEILRGISFKVEAGETVAIIGPTGSGKSSLIHLLARLYDYDSGSIKIDGIELKEMDKAWVRKNVALVLQEPFLYAKTIKENISLFNPRLEDKKIYESAKIASIHRDILTFKEGYNTPVGERGVSLSGGQKQRLAIARTIIRNSPITVFDDSLSAVDTETDILIRQALKRRKDKSTTIIISHRISTVKEADQILVLEDGLIAESGTHKSLLDNNGLYKRIYDIQNYSIDNGGDVIGK